jgi:dienelactone hydrolase
MRSIRPIVLALSLIVPATASAAIQTREVQLKQGGTVLKGFVAWDDAVQGRRPGVLVVHEWWGHDEHARNQARRLAEAGYVAFALDMYGGNKLAAHPDDAQKLMLEATKDPAALVARFNAAASELKADPHVDPTRIAAIGYCFGGAVVLNMARAGHPDLDAVASFHGVLGGALSPVKKGAVHARVLVLTGVDDSMVPAADVDAFRKDMDAAGATYAVVTYPGARHSFTNPKAGTHGMDALAYNAEADKRSWAAMLTLLKEAWK